MPDRSWLGVFVHGNELGELEPCACPTNPQGGLARRAAFDSQLRAALGPSVGVHLGGALCAQPGDLREPEPLLLARAELYFRAWQRMGVKVLHVGVHELAIGLPALQRLARQYGVALVSASLERLAQEGGGGALPLPPAVVLRLGGLRVGFIGLSTPRPSGKGPLALERGLDFAEPEVAARRGVAAARAGGAAVIIALTALKRPELHRLAAALPEVHAWLGSEGGEQTEALETLDEAVFVDSHRQGKVGLALLLRPPARAGAPWQPWDRPAALRGERTALSAVAAGFTAPVEAVRAELTRMTRRLAAVDSLLAGGARHEDGAGAFALVLRPLDAEVPDDPWVQARVEAHLRRYPQRAGR